jgi:hypothetical protein
MDPFATPQRRPRMYQVIVEKDNCSHHHCGFTLIKDPATAAVTPSNELSDKTSPSSDSSINVRPRESADSPLEINDTSLSFSPRQG